MIGRDRWSTLSRLAPWLAPLVVACGRDITGPGPAPEGRLATITEYLLDAPALKQRGTFQYDHQGRFVRFEFRQIEEFAGVRTETLTYFSNHFYTGERRVGGETFVRTGEVFVKSREWSYAYDARGRVDRFTLTTLLGLDFTPLRVTGTETYRYDDRDRLIEVDRSDGQRTRFVYDAADNLLKEEVLAADGVVLSFEHAYDDRRNPLYGVWGHGLVIVWATWAQWLSPHNAVRTETRVDGGDGIVSYREVRIDGYTNDGYPRQWVQRLVNTSDTANATVFVTEFTYGGDAPAMTTRASSTGATNRPAPRTMGARSVGTVVSVRLALRPSAPPAYRKRQHHQSEREQHQSPPQVHIDPERSVIDRSVGDEPVYRQDRTEDREHHPHRQSEVESHRALTRRSR
jgi:YD repeat-containing protein